MKRFFALISLSALVSGFFAPVYGAGTSQYASQIKKCIDARSTTGNVKTITEFVCPGGKMSNQEAAYQVVVDLEFKKIDKEIEAELKTLYESRGKNLAEYENFISSRFAKDKDEKKYIARFQAICDAKNPNGAVAEVIKYFGSVSTDFGTKDFLFDGNKCNALVNAKIDAYKNAAWLFAERGVQKSFEEDKHEYMVKVNKKYENFLFKWTTFIGQLDRIKNKWPSKTKVPNK